MLNQGTIVPGMPMHNVDVQTRKSESFAALATRPNYPTLFSKKHARTQMSYRCTVRALHSAAKEMLVTAQAKK
jgi:hypothetical protein